MTLFSPDGYWWWDGRRWVALYRPERQAELFWWTETPDWFQRVVLTGLIGLIPFVGAMVLYGWFLSLRDHLLAVSGGEGGRSVPDGCDVLLVGAKIRLGKTGSGRRAAAELHAGRGQRK